MPRFKVILHCWLVMSRVVFYTHFKEKLVKKSDSSDPEISKAGEEKMWLKPKDECTDIIVNTKFAH